MAEEGTDDGLRFAISYGEGFGPASKVVNADKEESLTVGDREGPDHIRVDVAEAGIR